MKGLAIIVVEGDDGPAYRVDEFDGDGDALREVVGGWIEGIPTDPLVTMWVNEEGKFQSLPVNRLAMDVWLRWDIHGCMVVGGDWIAGNCVVTGGVDAYGETLDLPDAARRWVLRVAKEAT